MENNNLPDQVLSQNHNSPTDKKAECVETQIETRQAIVPENIIDFSSKEKPSAIETEIDIPKNNFSPNFLN